MKGHLRIDFEIGPGGRTVTVNGIIQNDRGQAIPVAQDVLFCFGLLEYAKGLLWSQEAERAQVKGTGAIEVPVGVDAAALRQRGA